MYGHILRLHCNSYRKRSYLDHFGSTHSYRKREHVTALVRVPVNQDAWRRSHTPSIAQKVRDEVLHIHLAHGVRSWASDRPPLLWEHPCDELFPQITHHAG